MNLDPNILRGAYSYLLTTLPFRRWKLPDADEIEFHVTNDKHVTGNCEVENSNRFTIRVSNVLVGRTSSLMETLAHEMVHVYLFRKKVKALHGKEFQKLADATCREHGFDRALF